MSRSLIKVRSLLALTALSAAIGLGACSKSSEPSGGDNTGGLKVAFAVPNGFTISTVHYQILTTAGTPVSASAPYAGNVDQTNAQGAITFDVALPPGNYKLTLSATASPGSVVFSGTSGNFTITSGQTTLVSLTLQNTVADGGVAPGQANVTATVVVNRPAPIITQLIVAPLQVAVNGTINLSFSATDASGNALSYQLTDTPDGTFGAPSGVLPAAGVATTFTSAVAGTKTITVTVSDNGIPTPLTASLNVPVTFVNVAASGVIGPAGGSVTGDPNASVTIPANALGANTTITVADDPGAVPSSGSILLAGGGSGTVVGTPVLLGPEGTTFASPVTIILTVPAPSSAVTIYWAPAGSSTFTALPTTVVDSTHVSVQVTHFSVFAAVHGSGTGAGGTTGSGGAAAGGSTGSGGAATGGSTGTGGAATGGTTGTGGSATGGTTGTGGTATGGTTGTGGSATGGSSGIPVNSALELDEDNTLINPDELNAVTYTHTLDSDFNQFPLGWGPGTLPTAAQRTAAVALIRAIAADLPDSVRTSTNNADATPGTASNEGDANPPNGLLVLGASSAALISGSSLNKNNTALNSTQAAAATALWNAWKAAALSDSAHAADAADPGGPTATDDVSVAAYISANSINFGSAVGIASNVVQYAVAYGLITDLKAY